MHHKLLVSIETRGIPPILQNQKSEISNISKSATISMIQTALQPEIERRLDLRRQMDRLAVKTLLNLSQTKQCFSKCEKEEQD